MAPPPAATQSDPVVEGMLADFPQLRILWGQTSPKFVADLVRLFCSEGVRMLADLATMLEKPILEPSDDTDALVHQLKGSSANVGAYKVKDACDELRAFLKQNNKDGCLEKLNTAKIEFYEARGKFQVLLQHLERLIQGGGGAGQPNK